CHLHGAARIEHARDSCGQHRAEGPFPDRGHDPDRQQLAGRSEPAQGRALGGEEQLGHLFTQLSNVVGRDLLEVLESFGIAPQEPGELEDLGPDGELVRHPSTLRIGPLSSLGICPAALSAAAASSAAWRWRASRTSDARSLSCSSLSAPSEEGGVSRSSLARAFNPSWGMCAVSLWPRLRARAGDRYRHHYQERSTGKSYRCEATVRRNGTRCEKNALRG